MVRVNGEVKGLLNVGLDSALDEFMRLHNHLGVENAI